MTVSRRSVLRQGFVAALACVAGPLQAWSAKKSNSGKNAGQNNITNAGWQHLDRAAFTKAIGSGFKVSPTSGNGNSVWLRLLKVEDLPALAPVNVGSMAVPPKQTTSATTTTGYMLQFLGTLPTQLPQNTYTFEHPGLGKFFLLIVPESADGQTYTAVINVLK